MKQNTEYSIDMEPSNNENLEEVEDSGTDQIQDGEGTEQEDFQVFQQNNQNNPNTSKHKGSQNNDFYTKSKTYQSLD